MRHTTSLIVTCVATLVLPIAASAANTYKVNPFGISFNSTTGVSQYGRPGGMLITSDCNRTASAFATARANGAEILAYLNPVGVPDWDGCELRAQFYMGDVRKVPLWPYPTVGRRIHYPNTHMSDLRKNSAWSNHVVAFIEKLMREDKVDGVFLDCVGGRMWSTLADWDSWPQWEKDAWTDGAIDLVRRIDAKRRAINPRFIVVNNNVWSRGGADTRGNAGERYVDGVSIEHHPNTRTFHRTYVSRAFSNLGHRRVLIIGRGTADALAWKDVQGVTHVSNQWEYASVTAPPTGFIRLTDRPRRFGRASSGSYFTSGLPVNTKRGSRFSLSRKGQLLNMAALLDGNGGASSGSQSLRMALYRDSSGRPGTLVAQSNAVNVAADSGLRWVYFPSPAAKLDPGNYWIMIHSGSTSAIARNKGDGAANLHISVDAYSDGAENPGGTGSLGTNTLSLFAKYTVGY